VEFHQATIDRMPLADASVDCVISNCVLNLVPDKPAAFREIARILKPGGRLAASDIALKKPLPPEVGNDLMAYVGCIAGAILIDDYRQALLDASFAPRRDRRHRLDLNVYARIENQSACCMPAGQAGWPSSTGVLLRHREHAGASRTPGRPHLALQRERLCRQREGVRYQAALTDGQTNPEAGVRGGDHATRAVLTAALLLFVAVSVGVAVVREAATGPPRVATAKASR